MRQALQVGRLWLVCVIMVTIAGLVSFGAPVHATEQDSIDVPLGHWSYAAVESLAKTPLVAGSDVLFDNQTSVTRYEMALIVAKILRRLDDMGNPGPEEVDGLLSSGAEQEILDDLFSAAKQSKPGKGTLADEHLELIKRLVEGFNSELRALGLIRPSASATDFDLLFDPSAYRLGGGDVVSRGGEGAEEDPFRLSGWQSVISSDSTIWKTDGWELGASVSRLLGGYDEGYDPFDPEGSSRSKSVTSLEGKLQVTPGVRVSGEYATNPEAKEARDDASSMRVGAQMKMGDVEVGASYKNVRPQFDPLIKSGQEGKEATGYEVSLQYRDVLLSTGRETQTSIGEIGKDPETVTSVGLQYGLGEDLILRADYRYVDIDELSNGGEDASTTRRSTVGVGVSVPKGSMSLGFTYEQEPGSGRLSTKGASADIAHRAPWDSESVLQAGVSLEDMKDNKKATSLSLGYNYRKEAALVFGYKLIDFTESEETGDGSEGVATAELSIRF
jgi:hypothetical protein